MPSACPLIVILVDKLQDIRYSKILIVSEVPCVAETGGGRNNLRDSEET